ncbi:MAG TPA: FAD-binding domain [Rhizomicrobium sp.]|jgi:2-polyprenyl-6-methoxyphenol hydroxylase-like FAD-dependent oxidoreductase
MPAKSILICGAGIAGPAFAYWLRRSGFEPTLIERAPVFRGGGYMIDVWGLGYDLLARYGLLDQARERAYIFDRLKFVDEKGRELAGYGGDIFRQAVAGKFFSIPRGDLARTLYEPVAGKIETLYGTTIKKLGEDKTGVDVEFTNGETRRFDLVIGADGLRSHVRDMVFGPEKTYETYLGYYAASWTTEHYPHRDENTYLSYGRPGRQISRYAMRDDRTAFLLVFASKDKIAAHDADAQKAVLRAQSGRDGWESREILARLDNASDLYFDSVSQIRMPKWSKGRVALLGDAAHSPSLLAGAGSAFAMLGAYVLAGELKEAGGDHTKAFAAYENRLMPFMKRQQKTAEGFAGSFAPKTELGLSFRNMVLKLMNIRPLGVWLTRRMLGDSYPIPDYD